MNRQRNGHSNNSLSDSHRFQRNTPRAQPNVNSAQTFAYVATGGHMDNVEHSTMGTQGSQRAVYRLRRGFPEAVVNDTI